MKLSVVTSMYHSEKFIEQFYSEVKNAVSSITTDFEVIFVNDGSPDRSLQTVIRLQQSDRRIVAVDLSRNFGHHRALMTGLQQSTGEFVFLIDSDLEESPALIELYWKEMQADPTIDVVYGIQETRKGGWTERVTGRIWYSLFSFLSDIDYPRDSLTARLMKRQYVDSVTSYQEKELEIWGIFVLAGFNQKAVTVTKGSRRGSSTYTLARKLKMMVDSITSFSSKPLTYIFLLGLFMTLFSATYVVYLIVMKLAFQHATEGYTSTLVSIWFVGGLLIFCIGIIGIYLSKMFLEIKNRPLSIVRKVFRA